MHIYRNIIMHSGQNLNYVFFLNIYLIKNSWPCVFNTRIHLVTCILDMCINTRGHIQNLNNIFLINIYLIKTVGHVY